MKMQSVIRMLALGLVCLSLFCACGKGAYTLTYEDGYFRNDAKEASYAEAPVCYRACSALKGETVAKISGLRLEDVPLYAIENLDPDQYLTDESYTLYYSTALTLPTLAEMKPYCISLVQTGDNTATELDSLGEENTAEISDLVEILSRGTSYPGQKLSAYTPDQRFELLFHSKEYPGFFYVLEYWHFESTATFKDGETEIDVGKGVVYDRAADRFFVMGDILESYFINT